MPQSIGNGQDALIQAGGNAHLTAYIGHNRLMDYSDVLTPEAEEGKKTNDAIVLACMSKPYFLSRLVKLKHVQMSHRMTSL